MIQLVSFLTSLRSKNTDPRRAGRMRVSAYAGAIALGLGMFSWSKAKAEVGNQAVAFGQDLLPFVELLDRPQKITLNGEPIYAASGVGNLPLKQSLDLVERACSAQDTAVFKEAYKSAPTEVAALGILPNGVLRRADGTRGVVACISKPNGSATNLVDTMKTFQQSADLGDLGKLRYSYMTATKDGKTRALTVWTEDHFKLSSFAIEDGKDAPGSDPTLVPRPADSQRYLSAQFDGTPYGVWIYSTARSAEDVAASYDTKLRDDGWVGLKYERDGNHGRGFEKDGVELILSTGIDSETKRTVVTIAELGADQRAARARPSAP